MDVVSQNCINSLKRNDFKNCIKYLQQILDHLEMDTIVGLKIKQIKKKCYTSVICMYLEAFNYIEFGPLSTDLEIDQKKILGYVEAEIRQNDNFNFLINKVEGYVERKNLELDYVDLHKKSLDIMKNYNNCMLQKLIKSWEVTKMPLMKGDSGSDDDRGSFQEDPMRMRFNFMKQQERRYDISEGEVKLNEDFNYVGPLMNGKPHGVGMVFGKETQAKAYFNEGQCLKVFQPDE